MKVSIYLLLLFCVASCLGQAENISTETTVTDTTTVVTTPEQTSTSVPPTQSTLPPTSTTEIPTLPPKSTTEIPTTLPTTSTTEIPTTTSQPSPNKTSTTQTPTTKSPAPTTTELPFSSTVSPKPEPEKGSWNISSDNTTCIRAELKVLFAISVQNRTEYIALSPNASDRNSNCNASDDTQELVLTDLTYALTFIFEKSSDNVYVRNISLSYNVPGDSRTVENNTKLFSVKSGNCYLCSSKDSVNLDGVTMEIKYIKLQAFGPPRNADFGEPEECSADNKVNDIVPIIVGIALLGLVVVVLIAYLVGRRRSRQKGYQSM